MSIREIKEPQADQILRRAVLYARVSTKERQQGYSILAQLQLLRPYGGQNGFSIDEEFTDIETAKKPGRPGFNAMLRHVEKNPACRVILVEKTDRLYRNLADAGRVEEMGLEVHLVKPGQIISKASGAADKHRHGMDVLDAKRYSDNLSEEARKGMRTKAGQGLWPSYAPMGYRNTEGDDGKRIIVPDPVLGPMVTNAYEWFATGEYSLQRLARKAYEEGFRFRKSRDKVPVTTLHKILRNPIYMGEFDFCGVRYQGRHEPLVTRVVWDRVQEILDGRCKKKHRKITHEFAYSGMVNCGHCGCSLVGEVKKQRYVYYHCTGYRGNCGERYTREEILEQEFASRLGEVVLPGEILRWLEEELVESEKAAEAAQAQELRAQQEEFERLRRRQELMYEDRLDGRIDAVTYDQKVAQIRVQQEQIQSRIRAHEVATSRPGSQGLDLRAVVGRMAQLFAQQPASEQRRLLQLLVERAAWKNGALQISLREPFQALCAE